MANLDTSIGYMELTIIHFILTHTLTHNMLGNETVLPKLNHPPCISGKCEMSSSLRMLSIGKISD